MDTSMVIAWLVGEGIIVYRDVEQNRRPPLPAEILGVSGLFVLLGLFSEFQPGLATLLAWGLDIAAFLSLYNLKKAAPATTAAKK